MADGASTRSIVLADHTSFRLGGIASHVARVPCDVNEVVAFASTERTPDFVLGGGSNVLAADTGYAGLILQFDASHRIEDLGQGRFRASANTPLNELVDRVGAAGWFGMEQLAGIPGTVGGAVVQNAGAYDHSIDQILVSVVAVDLTCAARCEFTHAQCALAYRDSVFKRSAGRWAITEVTVQLVRNAAPVRAREISDHLKGAAASPQRISAVVREIRGSKDHLLQPGSHSAGSFFKNPRRATGDPEIARIDAAFARRRDAMVERGLMAPRTPTSARKNVPGSTSEVELVAGLLIATAADPSGPTEPYLAARTFGRLRLGRGGANTIINAGRATATEVVSLASQMRRAVRDAYGVLLAPEVVLLGDVALEEA